VTGNGSKNGQKQYDMLYGQPLPKYTIIKLFFDVNIDMALQCQSS